MSIVDNREGSDRSNQAEGHCDANKGVCAQEITADQWKFFLDDFSREQVNLPVSVEIRGETTGGAHWLTHEAPLLGMVAGEKEKDSIEILLGNPETGPITHIVHDASQLWQQQDPAGRDILQSISLSRWWR